MKIPVINGAFRPQRVTGQQRYAQEIADRLVRDYGVEELRITDSAGPLRAWLEAQMLGSRMSDPEAVLLTLTSRGPVRSRRQVVVVHDLFALTNPEWFSRRYALTHGPVLRAQIASAAAVVTVSPMVAEQVGALAGSQKKIVVAPNAPADTFLQGGGEKSELPKDLKGYRFMLCVGSMDPRKNLDLLVAAYAALAPEDRRELRLALVGASSGNFSQVDIGATGELEGLVRLGYVSDDELAAMYAHADAVLFPSLAEGFGLPIVEALAVGGRVIASDIPVFRWVGGDAVEYVDPRDPALWRGAMERVLAGSDGGGSRSCRQQVGRAFSWDSSASKVMELVTSL